MLCWVADPYQEMGETPWVQHPLWTLNDLCSPVQAALCLFPSSMCARFADVFPKHCHSFTATCAVLWGARGMILTRLNDLLE